MGKPAHPKHHELTGRLLVVRELCVDLATNHASRIADKRKRIEVQDRYKVIARWLYCLRAKRRTLFQQVMLNKALEQFQKSRHKENRWVEDLLTVYNDPHYSVHQSLSRSLLTKRFHHGPQF